MSANIEDSISTKELYKQYNWFSEKFPPVVQNAYDNFFSENFKLEFIGLSKNINCLLKDEYCFVTKIKIDQEYDMFFRLTEKVLDIILSKILGKSNKKFNINNISELEAKIITTFNGEMYDILKQYINQPDSTQIKRTNFDMIHLTFILKDLDENVKDTGKFIVTLPFALLSPEMIESADDKFTKDDFTQSEVSGKITIGKTRFSMYDLKNLEKEDVVVFEDSDLESLSLNILGEEMTINVNPNMDLLVPDNENNFGGNDIMPESKNLWDSIEVDMIGELDSVKISLGDLKSIEKGLVVDIASLYNNNVTLKVEGKPIAEGSLVIVNDRYGVKITEIIAGNDNISSDQSSDISDENVNEDESYESEQANEEEYNDSEEVYNEGKESEEGEEDFDYSDFELEDENL